ncbi:MAG: pilus (MSHA type) biogenesis protein MshL [Magnetococcales bacterium]|nr:pilus (MSHA type) biogenesis protein MshL [Magnetococcales bacterium]
MAFKKALWGILVLVIMVAGCSSPNPPDTKGKSKLLKRSHDQFVDGSREVAEHHSELRRDMERLKETAPFKDAHEAFVKESDKFEKGLAKRRRDLEQRGKIPAPLMPKPPKYNRLDDIPISLEMDKTDVRHLLQALAKQTQLNLLIHPAILQDPPIVSVSFRKVPASTVLREVLRLADLHGRVEENVLRVDPTQELMMNLNFLETNNKMSFNIGGDVIGSAQAGEASASGIVGEFKITGTGPENSNPYKKLEKMLDKVIGSSGNYSINRMTGTLFIKAKPSSVRTAVSLIQNYKEILSRQILIEARIMSITLYDQFKSGVDWAFLRGNIAATRGISQSITSTATNAASFPFNDNTFYGLANAGQGGGGAATAGGPKLTLGSMALSATSAIDGSSTIAGLGLALAGNDGLVGITLLKQFGDVQVLANPSVRARHGQPSMISAGTTSTYLSGTDVTSTTSNGTTTSTVEVTTGTVFDGLLLGVLPFISTDDRVTLHIHPMQSNVDSTSMGLNTVTAGSTTVSYTTPEIDLKEISTVLELNDGDTVFLGGLINKSNSTSRMGVPVISEIPVLGKLFQKNEETEEVKELIIMLRVTIL